MSQTDSFNTDVMFSITLEIATVLQSSPISRENEKIVLQMVSEMLLFRDNYGSISLLSPSNK